MSFGSMPINDYMRKFAKNSEAAIILLKLCPTIGALIDAIHAKLSPTEIIDIHGWMDNLFYIDIIDQAIPIQPGKGPVRGRCGFSVDIMTDKIVWNNSTEQYYHGGNCYLRSIKWKRFVNSYFPEPVTDKMMHFYPYTTPPKLEMAATGCRPTTCPHLKNP